jgi:hypothetical protein
VFDHISDLLLYFTLSALLPFVLFSLVVVFEAWYRKSAAKDTILVIVLLFGVTVIGTCAGFSGGMSRTGVVGNIIPAMFTLLGGLAVYLFGVDTTRGATASLVAGCLAISLFISYAFASQLRNQGDEIREERAFCTKAYSDGNIMGKKEALDAFEVRFRKRCAPLLSMEPGELQQP